MKSNRKYRLVTVIIKNGSNETLFLRRSKKNKHYQGYWQLPEGKIKKNEKDMEAMNRELKEEVGSVPDELVFDKVLNTNMVVSGVEIVVTRIIFKAKLMQQIILSEDHDLWRWMSMEECLKGKMVPGTKEVLEEL